MQSHKLIFILFNIVVKRYKISYPYSVNNRKQNTTEVERMVKPQKYVHPESVNVYLDV